jgi:hypothetical protein
MINTSDIPGVSVTSCVTTNLITVIKGLIMLYMS